MSDITELAAFLRRTADKINSERGHVTQHTLTLHKTADVLEAMAGARTECERQYQAKVEEVIAQMNRAEAAEAERDRLAGEVADALPWKLFYKDGLDLEQIGKRLGKSPYEFSPWLYAPLISQLKNREKTALADLAAERDRLKAALVEVEDRLNCRGNPDVAHYCPNCDNSLHKAREIARKALGGDAS